MMSTPAATVRAGIDVGKTHHWVTAVDAVGVTLLSVNVRRSGRARTRRSQRPGDHRELDDSEPSACTAACRSGPSRRGANVRLAGACTAFSADCPATSR